VTAQGRLGRARVEVLAGGAKTSVDVTVVPGSVAHLVAVQGAGQSSPAGRELKDLVGIRASDRFGNPVSGARIHWRAVEGAGAATPDPSTTDAEGVARTRWRLGMHDGHQHLEASAGPDGPAPALFEAAALPGPAARLEASDVAATAAAASLIDVTAAVLDEFGNAIQGAPVSFAVASGRGGSSPPAALTSADGRAVTQWTLGSRVGANELIVTSALIPGKSVTRRILATPGLPARVVPTEVTEVVAVTGQPVATLPAVRIEDASGNGIPGAPVHFRARTGRSVVEPEIAATDAGGEARVHLWIVCEPGTAALNAEVEGIPPATFTATAQGAARQDDAGTCSTAPPSK
jgi:hypothetical protein